MKVMVSGGFDPLHDGHVEYIQRASEHGEVIAVLNSDEWLARKKGAAFMPWNVRAKVVGAIKGVVSVYPVDDRDGTVCDAIRRLQPDYFANGGDRKADNVPEVQLCETLGIKLLFNLGEKINSSSEIVARQWGEYRVLYDHPNFRVKLLTLQPGRSTSLQRHEHRSEHWIFPATNDYRFIGRGETHKLSNPSDDPIHVVEVWAGDILSENDIERFI